MKSWVAVNGRRCYRNTLATVMVCGPDVLLELQTKITREHQAGYFVFRRNLNLASHEFKAGHLRLFIVLFALSLLCLWSLSVS